MFIRVAYSNRFWVMQESMKHVICETVGSKQFWQKFYAYTDELRSLSLTLIARLVWL